MICVPMSSTVQHSVLISYRVDTQAALRLVPDGMRPQMPHH